MYSWRTYQHFLDAALVRFLKQKHAITAGVDVPYTSLAEMQQHVRDECNRLGFPIVADPAILRRIQDLVGRRYFEQQGLSLFRYTFRDVCFRVHFCRRGVPLAAAARARHA